MCRLPESFVLCAFPHSDRSIRVSLPHNFTLSLHYNSVAITLLFFQTIKRHCYDDWPTYVHTSYSHYGLHCSKDKSLIFVCE